MRPSALFELNLEEAAARCRWLSIHWAGCDLPCHGRRAGAEARACYKRRCQS